MKTIRRDFIRQSATISLGMLAFPPVPSFGAALPASVVRSSSSRVVSVDGILKLEINGQVFDPLSFRSFRPENRNVGEFHQAGLKLMSILTTGLNCTLDVPYSHFGETWVGPGQYDFSKLDRQVELFLKNAPDTQFNLMFELDNRQWWIDSHPGTSSTYWNLVEMADYEPWRRDAAAYMNALIEHTEKNYGDRFFSYSLFCGSSTEWYQNPRYLKASEQSPLKRASFRQYTRNPNAELPSLEELAQTSHGLFRDPVKDERALSYWRFHHNIIADTILYFAAEAKKTLNRRKLLGLYYGYLNELHSARLLQEGHLGYEKVWASPDIDIIYMPASYGPPRDFGGASGFLGTIDSLHLKKKLYFHEIDHTTHVAPQKVENGRDIPGSGTKLKDARESIAVLRREFAMTRAKRLGLWWFDFFGGYYYDPALMKEVANMMQVQQKLDGIPMRSVAEIAVFGDVNSMFYVSQTARLNDDCLVKARDQLNRIGAPYDLYDFGYIEDSNIPHEQYKLYIFLNAFQISEAKKKLIDRQVKQKGRSALWIYAPGYIQEGGFDTKAMSEVVGMNISAIDTKEQTITVAKTFGKAEGLTYQTMLPTAPAFAIDDPKATIVGHYAGSGKPALGYKKIGTYTAYYSALGGLTAPVFREIARRSGVHIYYEGASPVYINNRLIGIHRQEATTATIHLPVKGAVRLEELFDGGELTVSGGTGQLPVDAGITKLYLLADSEIKLAKRG
jgi:hypothetical protein